MLHVHNGRREEKRKKEERKESDVGKKATWHRALMGIVKTIDMD